MSIAGHCGKCGAPYFTQDGAWLGVVPPPVTPTCACWNLPRTVTSTSFSFKHYCDCPSPRVDTGGNCRKCGLEVQR